jgi:hypothetical protein
VLEEMLAHTAHSLSRSFKVAALPLDTTVWLVADWWDSNCFQDIKKTGLYRKSQ